MSELDQSIYVANDKGAVELVTSLYLYVYRPNSSVEEEIGVATKSSVSERRPVQYNYVIGGGVAASGAGAATPRDIIPGVISESTIRLNDMALYKKNIIAALGDTEGLNWISSIRYQNRPFQMKEVTVHPNTGKVREVRYTGCMISDYEKTQDISGSDIRVLEDVTVHFKTVATLVDQIDSDN